MNYGIIIVLIASLILGTALGYFIGKETALMKAEEINPSKFVKIHPEEVVVITPENPPEAITCETQIESPEAPPTKEYYDCPLSEELQDYIRTLCEENGLPMSLIIAQIQVESTFRADVISGTNDYGLMQINKINHGWLSEKYGITDFLDPYQNVFCGIKMMAEHWRCYGDLDKALMAYNLGAGGARELWNQGIYLTEYVWKIKTAMDMLQIKEGV